MTTKTYYRVERTIVGLMMAGMVGMFQPLSADLFRYGFLVLLFSTIAFIVISHMSPRPESPDATGTVSLDQAVERAQGHDI
jgi:hypothetical protein